MTDFTMKLGNFEAVPEKGDDNFATSIYEQDYDGLLIARCNQNGRYPEQARAMLEGLNGKKLSLDEITALRSRAEKAEAEVARLKSERLYIMGCIDGFESAKEQNEAAEATCEKLAAALQAAEKEAGKATSNTHAVAVSSCQRIADIARRALSEYRKEASE